MALDDGVTTPDQGLFYANLVSKLGQPGAQAAIDLAIGQVTNAPVVSTLATNFNFWGNAYIGQSAGTTVFLIGPCSNVVQATNLILGYTALARPLTSNIFNPFLRQCAQVLVAQMGPAHLQTPTRSICVGYSMGGAIAWNVAYAILQAQGVIPAVITFGAPRAGGRAMATAFGSLFTCRWMAAADPIPSIPPRLADMPQGPTVFGVLNMLGFEWFVHGAGGLTLSTTGGPPVAEETPSETSLASVTAVPAFLLSQVTGVNTPHSLSYYINLLQLRVASTAGHAPHAPKPALQEQVNPVARNELNRAEQAQVRAVFAQGEAQNAQQAVIPPALQFRAVRLGAIWQVTFGGNVIATGPDKKRARGLARVGNDWLRRLGRQAVCDPVGTVNQLQQYMSQAVDPTSGVVPQINPNWPMA